MSREVPPTAIQALIVDDHAIVGQAFSNLLRLRFEIESTLALNAERAIAAARRKRFNIALIDLELSDGSGLKVVEALSIEQPDCALLIVSGHADTLYCPGNLRARIHTVINKSQALEELEAALQPLLKRWWDRVHQGDSLTDLTAREADVYRLMGKGMSCKQISAALNLTVRTVETHRKHIASKLGCSGAELVHKATLDQLRQRLNTGLERNIS